MKPALQPSLNLSLVDKAISLWKEGKLVAFPTETVYGLGADATNAEAVAGIYAVKSRPRFNPLIVHVADIATAKRYSVWNPLAEKLAAAFWPGPFTLVLKRCHDCPIADLVSAGGDTIALRVPRHPLAQELLKAWGGGIAAPSANRSGRVSPTTAVHVREEFGDTISLILDGGACEVGLESTVVDVSDGEAVLLRPGSITRAMIEKVVTTHDAQPTTHHLKSPGQLEKHYAPNTRLRLHATTVEPNEALLAFGLAPLVGAAAMQNLSPSGNLTEAAANLFAMLRALDGGSHSAIAVMPVPNEGIGEAINDRLTRAAAR